MLKTYLYVPEELNREIIALAHSQKSSKAAIIRQALEKGLTCIEKKGNASVQVLLKIAEIGRKHKVKGPKDGVERFDEYLYGKDWSKDK